MYSSPRPDVAADRLAYHPVMSEVSTSSSITRPAVCRRTFLRGGLVAGGALLTGTVTGCSVTPARSVDLRSGWSWTPQAAPLSLGITHTEMSIDSYDPRVARERAESVLAANDQMLQNQHLMGFGALNPEPSPGEREWARLDERFSLIERTGGVAVLTLAVAPDWMKGGQPGETDWSKVEVAPLPEFFDDFARLAAAAVQRYPQVTHVMVWNELKGFFHEELNNWDKEGYTQLYNAVYDAVKAVRPQILVGGPYMSVVTYRDPAAGGFPSALEGSWGVIDQRPLDVIEYWLANARGADFLVVDGSTSTRDAGLVVSPVASTEFFAVVTGWLRARTALPIWWSEFYVSAEHDALPASAESAATAIEAVAAMARSGVSTALLWQPQAQEGFPFPALWSATSDSDGGMPTALSEPWSWLRRELAAGQLWIGRSHDGSVIGFKGPAGILLLNTSGDDIELVARPTPLVLPPWQTVILPAGVAQLADRVSR